MVGEVVDGKVLPVQTHVWEQVQLVPKEEDLHFFTPFSSPVLTEISNNSTSEGASMVVSAALWYISFCIASSNY